MQFHKENLVYVIMRRFQREMMEFALGKMTYEKFVEKLETI